MRQCIVLLALAGTLAGCAGERSYDSADPINCLTIFSLTSAGASAGSNPRLAREMNARMALLAEKNGGAEWIRRVTPETRKLAAAIESSQDKAAALKLFDECAALHGPRV